MLLGCRLVTLSLIATLPRLSMRALSGAVLEISKLCSELIPEVRC